MKMTGAQIIIETLLEQGADTVFGYPGGSVLNIYDELYKNSDRIRHIIAAHEQGASHAADGYARTTGKTGVGDRNLRPRRNQSRHRHRNRLSRLPPPW